MKHKAKIAGTEDDIQMDVVRLNIGQIKITFLDPDGEPARGEHPLHRCNFRVEGPGIDPLRVKRVTIPPLDYGNPELLTVKVEMYPWNPVDFPPKEWAEPKKTITAEEVAESKAKMDATPVLNSYGYTVLEDGRLQCNVCNGLGLPPANSDGSIAEGVTGTLESINHFTGCPQIPKKTVQINDAVYEMTPDFMIHCKHCGATVIFAESEKIQHKPDCPHYGKGW